MCTRKCLPLVGLVSVIALAGCQKAALPAERPRLRRLRRQLQPGSTAAATTETKGSLWPADRPSSKRRSPPPSPVQLKLAV